MHIIIIHDRESKDGSVVCVLMTDDKTLNRAAVENAWRDAGELRDRGLDGLYEALAHAGHTFDVLDDYPANHVYLSEI